ncbi:MAG: DUF3006 domain-containing protein [Clostridia bacterium]|nr:DUF3006 domain-containing protein [Clostridia bacterium]
MSFSVDRIEGDLAVLEDENGVLQTVPLMQLPLDTREGSVLRLENGVWTLDADEAARRRAEALRLQALLRKKKR